MHFLQDMATVGVVVLALSLLIPSAGTNRWRWPLLGLCAAFVAFKAFTLLHIALEAVRNPPLWDFKAFYMFGRVAAAHHNVYDPASYQMYGPLLNPTGDPEFKAIALDIGFPYPPPAVLLVYPLGLFANVSTAMTAWYVAIFGAMAASIVLLWRTFFSPAGSAGLIVASVLVLAMPATIMNIGLAQVTFFVMLVMLLFWAERIPWRAGLWLAPLVVLRPLFAVLALFFAVRRQWSALVSLALTGIALVAISIPLLGPNGFTTYLVHNPVSRYPGTYFLGTQCLYKLLATVTHNHDVSFSLTAHPVYLILAALTVLAAACICALCAKRQPDACLGLLLAVALWVYPSTDTHYCVLLLVPMCAVWRNRARLGLSARAVVVFFGAHYLLLAVRSGMHTTGLVIALDCLFFGVLAFRRATPKVRLQPRRVTAPSDRQLIRP